MLGIIAEFDPFHRGHEYLIREARRRHPGEPVVVVMSGWFTQRGGPAALSPHARAEMALLSGADLVLELPLPFAISSAEGFGLGGAAALAAVGVTTLAFGSESGDGERLRRAAECLDTEEYPAVLREELSKGVSFAAARQSAVSRLCGTEVGSVLSTPNDLLGVSYLSAIRRLGAKMEVCPIPRRGPQHNAEQTEGGFSSASHIRQLLRAGDIRGARELVPPGVAHILERELQRGMAPADLSHCERGVLYRLRMMGEEDFLALPDVSEGLEHRLYRAAQQAVSLDEFYSLVKSRRYAHARIRRLTLWAFLGMTRDQRPAAPLYLRVLGMTPAGQQILHQVRKTCPLPLITKPAAAKKLEGEAAELFSLEMRSADLWRLCLPGLERSQAGQEWREGVVRIESVISCHQSVAPLSLRRGKR